MSITEFKQSDTLTRNCLQCGHILQGRTDKKFCDDFCRNTYNYEKSELAPIIKRINHILKRNRHILKDVLENRVMVVLDKQVLSEMDFNFCYHTHVKKDDYGNTIYYCYEYAFRLAKNTCIIYVKEL